MKDKVWEAPAHPGVRTVKLRIHDAGTADDGAPIWEVSARGCSFRTPRLSAAQWQALATLLDNPTAVAALPDMTFREMEP